ncbi:MAG: redoxin domain-containing protein [Anaerolineae bacterium]|jgi:peroxiredoxin|nr:redoxin domain-containing protein [Anaerolineae bacterium]MBT7189776.1 redoxin domain-containing protein [Anaerolineae bacterium]MBT7991143.1 redoxin domain-containing protein [Anaerolineae bacterium]
MQQIVDLQNSPEFQALDVQVISIARDTVEEMAPESQVLGISSVPILSDPDLKVSAEYDVLQWAIDNGEPSHTFVLVDGDGQISWIKDYGAPDNPERTMYVEVDELIRFVSKNLNQ